MVVDFVMNAVAGARRTPGRLKTGGVPPKTPATIFLSLLPSLFWDFGSLFRTFAASFSDTLSRQPSSSSSSLRRLWLGVAAQASGTSLSWCRSRARDRAWCKGVGGDSCARSPSEVVDEKTSVTRASSVTHRGCASGVSTPSARSPMDCRVHSPS